MSISILNYLRDNEEARQDLNHSIELIGEYLEQLETALEALDGNTSVEEADGGRTERMDRDDGEEEMNAKLITAVDGILGHALDANSLLNEAAKAEIARRITKLEASTTPPIVDLDMEVLLAELDELESSAPKALSTGMAALIRKGRVLELSRLQRTLAALQVPHSFKCERSLDSAEAAVLIAEDGYRSKTARSDAARIIERGVKAMAKKAA